MALLSHIYSNLNATFFKEAKTYIQEKLLQFTDLSDLNYHAKVLKLVINDQQTNSTLKQLNSPAITLKTKDGFASVTNQQDDFEFQTNKASIQTIWAEPPQIILHDWKLSQQITATMYSEICARIDTQKAQIEKRKDDENKRKQIKEG